MKKVLIFALVAVCLAAACVWGFIGYMANRIDPTMPIFETQNIERITLFRLPDQPDGVEVPGGHMEEITAWLGTFTVGEREKDALCGVNMFTFRIEYSDGTVVTSGADTTTIDGVIYRTVKGPQPACINELLAERDSEQE